MSRKSPGRLKLPDINLWLAATIGSHVHHDAAKAWLESQSEPKSIALCRVTQQGWLRLLTQESLMEGHGLKVLTNKEAWALWTKLAADERMVFLAEPEGIERRWQAYAAQPSAFPKLWTDAYLAAFAVAAGCELVTLDRGFGKFAGLRVELLAV